MSNNMNDEQDTSSEKQLVALKYDQKSAPKVTVKAYGSLAEELLEIWELSWTASVSAW